MSALQLTVSPLITSGAIQYGVPATDFWVLFPFLWLLLLKYIDYQSECYYHLVTMNNFVNLQAVTWKPQNLQS